MIAVFHQSAQQLIHHYGSFALFGLLAFGIIGLPIPDETLLLISGFLAAKGEIAISNTILAAILGSCIGITVSFLIGRYVGYNLIHAYGQYIGITETKLKKGHDWFEKFGKYLLFFGYFIPGVRHLTGITAGATKLEYPVFAIFAYAGATLWSLTFIITGYFFFSQWQHWHF